MLRKTWITPSWLILLADGGLAVAAMMLSLSLILNFKQAALSAFPLLRIAALVLVVHILLSLMLGTYKGIIRHTGMSDIHRVSCLNILTAAGSLGIYFIMPVCGPVFLLSLIIVSFFVCTFFLSSYRLLVKWLFRYYGVYRNMGKTRVAIYGAGPDGMIVLDAINSTLASEIKVVAFVEHKYAHAGKSIRGLPIYGAGVGQLQKLKEREHITLLIVTIQLIGGRQLDELLKRCMNLGIEVKKVLPLTTWINSKPEGIRLQNIKIEDLLDRPVIEVHNKVLAHQLFHKRVLVTGAAGSIGSELARQLMKYGPSVVVLCDQAESPLHELELELLEKETDSKIIPFIGSVCDKLRMQQLFEIYKPDMVYHAAAYKHVPMMEKSPSISVLNNVLGTKVMAELSVAFGVQKFVMVSTDKAVNPTSIMGTSKRIAEIYIQSYYDYLREQHAVTESGELHEAIPTSFITTRFGNVLGSNGSVLPRFTQQLEKGGPLTVTHPDIIRYFMTIPEACRLVLEASLMGQGGEIFVFDMGRPIKIDDLARKIIRMSGKEPDKDIKIVYTGLRPGEKLYEELLDDAENLLPTYHEKIMIARMRGYNFQYVGERVNRLIAYAQEHHTASTVKLMKELVPEFVSKNLVFEQLDKGKVSI